MQLSQRVKEVVLFLKKEPKNFCPLARVPDSLTRVQAGKVFLLLFLQKKKNPSLKLPPA
ncbi:MAG: hypothetical protein NTY94_15070 [Alphaproteobacteria bacterium]|jgi:hypothetical protein|nr:hypothetical protein [Alphaproteobacteria bacterium]